METKREREREKERERERELFALKIARAHHASAGNRTRVTSMATMYSTTKPLMLLGYFWHRVYIIVLVLSVIVQEDLRLEQNPTSGAQKSKPPGAMRNRHLMGF